MYKHILHPTDLDKNHYHLCQQAVEIAKHFKASLHLLHVIEIPATIQLAQSLCVTETVKPSIDEAMAVLEIIGDSLKIKPKNLYVKVGTIKNEVCDTATALNCNLIIVGSHTPSNLPNFLGSTAHEIIQHAPCDVLTIKVFAEPID